MRAALPTDLLLRLMNATPEQYAAVERVLGVTGETLPEPVTDDMAVKLFGLVKALESERHYRKVPVLQVFRLYCLESLSCREIAKVCRCSLSVVADRLKAIEQKLGRRPEELRAYSSSFERIADSLTDHRARRIRREDAINGDEHEEF